MKKQVYLFLLLFILAATCFAHFYIATGISPKNQQTNAIFVMQEVPYAQTNDQ